MWSELSNKILEKILSPILSFEYRLLIKPQKMNAVIPDPWEDAGEDYLAGDWNDYCMGYKILNRHSRE